MTNIEASAIIEAIDAEHIMKKLEGIGRVCYRSEDKIRWDSADKFVRNLIRRGHESVLEHVSVTANLVVDRAVAQEITRHRIGSYTHESTRYVKYNDIEVIMDKDLFDTNYMYLLGDQVAYNDMIANGVRPEIARDVLPICLASRLVVTYNLRQWRHFFKLRYVGSTGRPHPKIKHIAGLLLGQFKKELPVIFEDFPVEGEL